jgi:hypothetical protein
MHRLLPDSYANGETTRAASSTPGSGTCRYLLEPPRGGPHLSSVVQLSWRKQPTSRLCGSRPRNAEAGVTDCLTVVHFVQGPHLGSLVEGLPRAATRHRMIIPSSVTPRSRTRLTRSDKVFYTGHPAAAPIPPHRRPPRPRRGVPQPPHPVHPQRNGPGFAALEKAIVTNIRRRTQHEADTRLRSSLAAPVATTNRSAMSRRMSVLLAACVNTMWTVPSA